MFQSVQLYPASSRLVLLLFAIYIPTWFLEIGKRVQLLGAIRFEYVLAAFLSVLALHSLLQPRNGIKNPLVPYIFIYFFVLAIQLPFAQDFDRSWDIFYNRVIKFSFMALFISTFVRNPSELRLFIGMFLLSCMKIGQEAFIGKITGSMVWENQGIMRLNGPEGTLVGHPNSLSGNAIGTLPFLQYVYPLVGRIWKLPLLLQFIFAINIIIFTGSRTGYVGVLLFCLISFLRSEKRKRFLILMVVVFFISIIFLPESYQERFDTIFGGQEKEGASRQSRIELFYDSVEVFIKYPFGVGMGGFRIVRNRELGKAPMDTHNLYTELLSETGIQGFLIFSMVIYQMLRQLQELERNIKRDLENIYSHMKDFLVENGSDQLASKHILDLKFMRAICLATFSYLVIRLGIGLFGHDLYEIYWWIASGLTVAITNIYFSSKALTDKILSDKFGIVGKDSVDETQRA